MRFVLSLILVSLVACTSDSAGDSDVVPMDVDPGDAQTDVSVDVMDGSGEDVTVPEDGSATPDVDPDAEDGVDADVDPGDDAVEDPDSGSEPIDDSSDASEGSADEGSGE
jgi:hypothetical protein